jgi:hypothetical protein
MIIAYYPGAGGNRYLQRLLGNDWAKLNRSYDSKTRGQQFEHRYLLDAAPTPTVQHILTHCMNSAKIQQVFPGQPMVFINSSLCLSLQREWALHGHDRYLAQTVAKSISRLEHYVAFKDKSWPDITSEDQIDQLPLPIRKEVVADYQQVTSMQVSAPELLSQLTTNAVNKINSAYETICWHQNYYTTYPVDFSGAEQVIDIDAGDNEFSLLMQTELNQYHSEIFKQVWDAVNE